MSKELDIVGLGNALMDALVVLPDDSLLQQQNLKKGEMHMAGNERWQEVYSALGDLDISLQTGGSCANTIAILGLLGAKTSYCSQVGNDEFGKLYTEQLIDALGQHAVIVSEQDATGKCLSLISQNAERTLVTDLGAAIQLPSIDHFAQDIRSSQLLYLTGYLMFGDMRKRMMSAIAIAKEAGVKVALDVADPGVIAAMKEDMYEVIRDHVDMVFLNQSEAQSLCGGTPESAIEELSQYCEIVVVKMGSKGSMVCRGNEKVFSDIVKVDAVDTTGAGDSYAAGFLYGWINDWSLQKSADLGSRIASAVVSQLGAVIRDRSRLAGFVQEING